MIVVFVVRFQFVMDSIIISNFDLPNPPKTVKLTRRPDKSAQNRPFRFFFLRLNSVWVGCRVFVHPYDKPSQTTRRTRELFNPITAQTVSSSGRKWMIVLQPWVTSDFRFSADSDRNRPNVHP